MGLIQCPGDRPGRRVAIAEHRLVSLTAGEVSFQARDNSQPGQKRLVTLPSCFDKIRHYGHRAPGNVKTKLELARTILSLQAPGALHEPQARELDTPSAPQTWQERLRALTGVDLTICPNCGGRLLRRRLLGNEATPVHPVWDSS